MGGERLQERSGAPLCPADPGFWEARLGAHRREVRVPIPGKAGDLVATPIPGWGCGFGGGGLARPSLGRGFRAGNAGSWQRQAAFLLTIPVHVPEASIVHVEDFDGGTRSKKCGGLFSPTLRFSRTLKTQNLNFEGTGHRVCCAGHVCTLTSFLFFVIWGFDL